MNNEVVRVIKGLTLKKLNELEKSLELEKSEKRFDLTENNKEPYIIKAKKAIILNLATKEDKLNALPQEEIKQYITKHNFKIIKAFKFNSFSEKNNYLKTLKIFEVIEEQKETIALLMNCPPSDLLPYYDWVHKLNELLECKKIEMHFYKENVIVDKMHFHYQGKHNDFFVNMFSYSVLMNKQKI